jgi:hypothetical protein
MPVTTPAPLRAYELLQSLHAVLRDPCFGAADSNERAILNELVMGLLELIDGAADRAAAAIERQNAFHVVEVSAA